VGKRGIACNDLDHALVEQLDVGGEPADAAARNPLQHRIFQQSRGILGSDFLGAELAANDVLRDLKLPREIVREPLFEGEWK
jgi:hypothetical protein